MIRDRLQLLTRRTIVIAGVALVIMGALVTVEAAAQWRAASASFAPMYDEPST